MVKAIKAVVDEVNAAGGVLGRKIELVSEDDQTNPEAAVRAARKLIDVDKVSAIMGTWASAVTTAVAPLCWEIENLPHHRLGRGLDHPAAAPGLSDPHAAEHDTAGPQVRRVRDSQGAKRVFFIAPQTPFTQEPVRQHRRRR